EGWQAKASLRQSRPGSGKSTLGEACLTRGGVLEEVGLDQTIPLNVPLGRSRMTFRPMDRNLGQTSP
ncbi:MAG: hypothetical protein WCO50_09195, partial [Synechococcus sp. ELA619]